jgi:hypothetical protein
MRSWNRRFGITVGLALLSTGVPTGSAQAVTTATPTNSTEAPSASECHWKVVWSTADLYEKPRRDQDPRKRKRAGDIVGPFCRTVYNDSQHEYYVMVQCDCAADNIGWMRRNACVRS